MPKLRFTIENKSFYNQEIMYRKIISFTLDGKTYNRSDYTNANIIDFYRIIIHNETKITLIKSYHKKFKSFKDNNFDIIEDIYHLKNKKLHNTSGPTFIHISDLEDNTKYYYYINGVLLEYEQWLKHPAVRKEKLVKLLAVN